jgi:hypothetical protein
VHSFVGCFFLITEIIHSFQLIGRWIGLFINMSLNCHFNSIDIDIPTIDVIDYL